MLKQLSSRVASQIVPRIRISSSIASLATMSKPKVILLGEVEHAHDTWKALSSKAELMIPKSQDRESFIKECRSGDLDGVVAGYRTFFSVKITGRWDEELVDALPKSFKLIAHNGAGYDQIDPEPLRKRGILATHVPTAVDNATADTGIFLMLGALRNFSSSQFALRGHRWRGRPAADLGHDPQGKTLGVLGMGGIGLNMAKKAGAFGMKIIYHNRSRLDGEKEKSVDAGYVSFDELLAQSDVLSIHTPLNAKTRHLINKDVLSKMKKGVVIVNTARGGVIDEAALVEALDSGQVGAVGLDVYEEEPKVHEGLINNERALLLPHMGTWTTETQTAMEEWNIGNISTYLDGADKWDQMSVIGEHRDLLKELLKSNNGKAHT